MKAVVLFVALAASVSASSSGPVDVPVSAPLHQEVARAAAASARKQQAKKAQAKASGDKTISRPVTNVINSYTIPVNVGKPYNKGQLFNVVFDTGSSNLWVGCAGKSLDTTQPSVAPLNYSLDIQYGIGAAAGPAYRAHVSYGGNLYLHNKTVSSVDQSQCGDLGSTEGIAGFGPIDLSNNFYQNGTFLRNQFEEPVVDVAKDENLISKRVLGVSFEPTTTNSTKRNGLVTFGGVNKARYTGDINYVPLTTVFPTKFYWGIDLRLSVGGKYLSNTTGTSTTKFSGIVDTGTTLVGLVTPLLDGYFKQAGVAYQYNETTATSNVDSTLPSVKSSDAHKLKDLDFHIGSQVYTLSASQLIAPTAQVDGAKSGRSYILFYGMEVSPRANIPVIVGQKFLERFYSVYSSDPPRMGFARTKYSAKTSSHKRRDLH